MHEIKGLASYFLQEKPWLKEDRREKQLNKLMLLILQVTYQGYLPVRSVLSETVACRYPTAKLFRKSQKDLQCSEEFFQNICVNICVFTHYFHLLRTTEIYTPFSFSQQLNWDCQTKLQIMSKAVEMFHAVKHQPSNSKLIALAISGILRNTL